MKDRIFKLKGKVQHYAWGGYEYIPSLLGIDNHESKPYAEYWMGAHPSASSEVNVDGENTSLYKLIQTNAPDYIGDNVFKNFGELSFLFKVLDVKNILSIQVHPTKEEAVKGFEAEEAAGIPITAPHRNYKDRNHKPEVMVALSEFWLLHGFKQKDELERTLQQVHEFNFLLPILKEQGYYGLYKEVMEMSQQEVNEVLLPLVNREKERQPDKNEPGYWVNKLYALEDVISDIDRGVFSIYFFNIMHLLPGEAVFQGAGIPHAYLEGQNVELMANSDNVLRGGLTSKHIDVPELLKHTTFAGVKPAVLKGSKLSSNEINYDCPVPDFAINAIHLKAGKQLSLQSHSPEIFIVIKGSINISEPQLHFKKGEAFFIIPETEYMIKATIDALIYKAFVPH